MSDATIARWNSIPLERPEPSHLKRSRPEEATRSTGGSGDDDDDVSIVSRSPSPQPDGEQPGEDIYEYDKYAKGATREVITVDTKIKPTNKGFAMLAKLGWVEGQPLGISGEGRVDPIPFALKNDFTGLGKTSQDFRMIETTVSSRRNLDSERQHKETEEQRQLREDAAARKSALATEISSTLRAFYCTLCDKQFQTVAQYDEHTNSYAHHHKARAKDMQANSRLKPKEETEKRKEKERRREEKELRKLAAAQGIRLSKPAPPVGNVVTSPSLEQPVASKGGWTAISGATSGSPNGPSGWTTVTSTGARLDIPIPNPETSDMDVDGAPITRSDSTTLNLDKESSGANISQTKSSTTGLITSAPTHTTESRAQITETPPVQESSRSSWQKFQKSGRRR